MEDPVAEVRGDVFTLLHRLTLGVMFCSWVAVVLLLCHTVNGKPSHLVSVCVVGAYFLMYI